VQINFDVAAIVGIGSIAATIFWRQMARIESKVDHLVDNMVNKESCAAHRNFFTEMFNGHDHTPEGDLVVIRRSHGPVHQETEGVSGSGSKLLPEAAREDME